MLISLGCFVNNSEPIWCHMERRAALFVLFDVGSPWAGDVAGPNFFFRLPLTAYCGLISGHITRHMVLCEWLMHLSRFEPDRTRPASGEGRVGRINE